MTIQLKETKEKKSTPSQMKKKKQKTKHVYENTNKSSLNCGCTNDCPTKGDTNRKHIRFQCKSKKVTSFSPERLSSAA